MSRALTLSIPDLSLFYKVQTNKNFAISSLVNRIHCDFLCNKNFPNLIMTQCPPQLKKLVAYTCSTYDITFTYDGWQNI